MQFYVSHILSIKGMKRCQADVFKYVPPGFNCHAESSYILCLFFPSFYLCFCLQSVVFIPSNNKSALPYKLKSPQVRTLQGGPAIRQQPSIQWTVASLGLKTAASSVPLAHWLMDKALDFTLLKGEESARGAMKSIDPSLNGFVRGFRLANHGWKSPLNKTQLLSKELGQIHQREEGKDNDSSWPDVRCWLHLHAMWDHVNKSNNRQTTVHFPFLLPSLLGGLCLAEAVTWGETLDKKMYTQIWDRKAHLICPQGGSFSYLNSLTVTVSILFHCSS